MSYPSGPSLHLPPLPPLTWDAFCWTGPVVLPAWRGFQARLGPYGSVSSSEASDGTVRLNIEPPGGEGQPPSAEQVEAYRYLAEHDEALRDAILRAVYAAYPALRETYGYGEEGEDIMPVLERPDELRALVGLSNVHLLTVAGGGLAYVGYEFGCTWDDEHGLGVMVHRDRVVEVGGADTAFLEWIAENDLATPQ